MGGTWRAGQAELKPSHYAARYRDQKATSRTNEASAWAEPLPGMDGRDGSMHEQTASSSPAGKTGSGLLANPVALLSISVVVYSYSISTIRLLVFNQEASLP